MLDEPNQLKKRRSKFDCTRLKTSSARKARNVISYFNLEELGFLASAFLKNVKYSELATK